jgi:heterodisulfide reductase subunit A
MSKTASVVVIGGGIAGIQASLDLADRGVKVHLVEKSPSIGGKMALLDKTFPTMDCAICILAPKMIEVYRHSKIDLLTLSEVTHVEGDAGDFKVTVTKRPRYINESKCIGCGVCASKCPVKVPDEAQMGLSMRRAAHIPFPQAVPLIYSIDGRNCLNLTKGICRVCEKFCEAGAIDFNQKTEEEVIDAASIIVATGLDTYDPTPLKEYGYNRFKNVVTALELERMITATGPTGGQLLKPSDGGHPDTIAFIQCVGSRSLSEGYPYCSAVCCMHATKEAILIREHSPDAKVSIIYTDMRAFGKGFKEFVNRARDEYGVEYIRGKPAEVREEPQDGSLSFWYEDTATGEIKYKHVDLLVLCTALTPSHDNRRLAEILGVELDDHDFFYQPNPILSPLATTKDGIFVCGYSQGPKDIPDAIAEASGATALSAEVMRRAIRG